MHSGGGDIVTVLDADIQPFKIGLQSAGHEAMKFGKDFSGNMGRSLGQVGFALQDFTSVLAMGGKNSVGRALMSTMNNVQMLGAAFGPMGMAITSVGGALASMLIPKLLETSEKVNQLAEDFKAAAAISDEAAKKFASREQFKAQAGNLGSAKQGNAMLDDLRVQAKIAEDHIRRQQALQEAAKGELANAKNPEDEKTARAERDRLQKDIEESQSRLQEIRHRQSIVEARTAEAEASEAFKAGMDKALQRDKEKLRAMEAQQRLEEQQLEQQQRIEDLAKQRREHEINALRERTATPRERLDVALRKASDVARESGDYELGGRAMDMALADYSRSLGGGQQNRLAPLAMIGSAEAANTINQAALGSNDPQKQLLDQAKQEVTLARQQLRVMEQIAAGQQQIVAVNLN